MKQARWGRKEITLPIYLYIYIEAGVLAPFGAVILETAETWTGANRYQKEPTAISSRPSRSPSFAARQCSQRLLMLCKPITSSQVRSAQQEHQVL